MPDMGEALRKRDDLGHSISPTTPSQLHTQGAEERIPDTATWMDLEIMVLSNVSQKEKDKYHMILLIRGI